MQTAHRCQVATSRPDQQIVRAKKREIANHYRKAKARNRRSGWWRTRIGALNKVFGGQFRYGDGKLYQLTDDTGGREDLRILVDHYASSNPLAMSRVIKARAPWLSESERESLVDEVGCCPRYWDSTALADALGLTEAERIALGGVPTIGAVDVTPDERKAAQRKRDYARKQAKRRNRGVVARTEWLAVNNLTRCKPWENQGMSRAQWYRCRHETGESGVTLVNTADRPVSKPEPKRPLLAVLAGGLRASSRPNTNAQHVNRVPSTQPERKAA
jgi:hypothetical protein